MKLPDKKPTIKRSKECVGKKHPCKDCTCCQFCSDIRCEMCRKPKSKKK